MADFPDAMSGRTGFKVSQRDLLFLDRLKAIESNTCCSRAKCGCLIERDGAVLVTGYAAVPPGDATCLEAGHVLVTVMKSDGDITEHCVRCIHAEQMAIAGAARKGICLDGATIYCSFTPCLVCSRLILFSGIVRVVARRYYHTPTESVEFLSSQNIEIIHSSPEVQSYGGGCDA